MVESPHADAGAMGVTPGQGSPTCQGAPKPVDHGS